MVATLHVPYGYGDCVGGFAYGKEIDQVEYANMLISDYNAHCNGIDDMMTNRFGRNIAQNTYQKEFRKYTQQKQEFFSMGCYVDDKDFDDMKIEKLLDIYRSGDSCVMVVRLRDLRELKKDPDFESDLKIWMKETMKIDASNELTEVEKFKSFSKKDLKLTLAGSNMSAVLLGCKMVSVYSGNKFGLWVSSVRFAKD